MVDPVDVVPRVRAVRAVQADVPVLQRPGREQAMKVLVCGSRDWADVAAIGYRLSILPAGTEVLHGGARGADSIAEEFCIPVSRRLVPRCFQADWATHGKRAGILRNLQMLDERPDLVIAFWDGKSKGTAHTIGEARKRGIPVEVIPPSRPAVAARLPFCPSLP